MSLASGAVALAVLLGVNALPHEQLPRVTLTTRSSVVAQALAQPRVPVLALGLPADVAVPLPPGRVVGDYGPARPQPNVKSYKLRGSNDIVTVVLVPDAPPVFRPSDAPRDALSVHGQYAASYTVEATSVSVVRWTEHDTTYEISSRTLFPRDLARLAEQVR
jgi:hypothetical protein